MSHLTGVSARSLMTAGACAAALTAVVGAVTIAPLPASGPPAAASAVAASPKIQLTAATSPGGFVRTAYDTVEPWVAYGFELADYALSYVPGLWWIAPGIDLAYFSIEPLVQAAVYSFADLIDLNFAQIGPDIQAGIAEATQNFLDYGAQWIADLIPFPPLPPVPPLPPLPGALVVNSRAAAATTTATPAAGQAPRITAPTGAATVETVEPVADIVAPESTPPPARTPRAQRHLTGKAGRAAGAATAIAAAAEPEQPAGANRISRADDRPATPTRASAPSGRNLS